MKLYVCYGTFSPAHHACGKAHAALKDAGWEPEVIKSYGAGMLPAVFNRTRGRQDAKRLTGSHMVPVLVTDAEEVVQDSARIAEWARAHPAA